MLLPQLRQRLAGPPIPNAGGGLCDRPGGIHACRGRVICTTPPQPHGSAQGPTSGEGPAEAMSISAAQGGDGHCPRHSVTWAELAQALGALGVTAQRAHPETRSFL